MPLTVPLAYGSKTGFKNVHEVRPGCFQARIHIKNKGRWTSETAQTPERSRRGPWMLARWRLDPSDPSHVHML